MNNKNEYIFASAFIATGALAQLVEQRTENPCVPGSIPGGTTNKNVKTLKLALGFFSFKIITKKALQMKSPLIFNYKMVMLFYNNFFNKLFISRLYI